MHEILNKKDAFKYNEMNKKINKLINYKNIYIYFNYYLFYVFSLIRIFLNKIEQTHFGSIHISHWVSSMYALNLPTPSYNRRIISIFVE